MNEPRLEISHNFEKDTIELRRVVNGIPTIASIPRGLCSDWTKDEAVRDGLRKVGFRDYEVEVLTASILRPGTAGNEVNRLMNVNPPEYWERLYGPGMTNAAPRPKKFPRSGKELDKIMIRRVNARLRLKQESRVRHYWHIGIGIAIAALAPLVFASIMRLWWFSLAWMAS